jgi:hypothetical protein
MCVSFSSIPSLLINPSALIRYGGEAMGIKGDKFYRGLAIASGDPMGVVANKRYEQEAKEQKDSDKRARQMMDDYYAKAAAPSPFTTQTGQTGQNRNGGL